MTDTYFTQDWFNHNSRGLWSTMLRPYRGKPNVKVLEIGCFEGRASLWLMLNILFHPSSTLTVVDTFTGETQASYPADYPGIEAIFDRNLAAFTKQIKKYKGFSADIVPTLPKQSYDFVYVDGCHEKEEVYTDGMNAILHAVKKGGLVCFDDYQSGYEPTYLGISKVLEDCQDKIEVINVGYQVWCKVLP